MTNLCQSIASDQKIAAKACERHRLHGAAHKTSKEAAKRYVSTAIEAGEGGVWDQSVDRIDNDAKGSECQIIAAC